MRKRERIKRLGRGKNLGNRIAGIIATPLGNNRGASMLFVLASMLLLMTIGISSLTAAGANYGAGLARRAENQLNLFMNSMELTLRAAMEEPDTPGERIDAAAKTLNRLILQDLYLNPDTPRNLNPVLPDGAADGINITRLVLNYENVTVRLTPAVGAKFLPLVDPWVEYSDVYDEDGNWIETVETHHEGRTNPNIPNPAWKPGAFEVRGGTVNIELTAAMGGLTLSSNMQFSSLGRWVLREIRESDNMNIEQTGAWEFVRYVT
jgi:hypothetical protein